MIPTKHTFFSPARIWALALNTLLELVRLKVFYFLVIFGLIGVGISFFTATLRFQEQFQVLKDAALGSMTIFTWLLATLATAMMLPKDLEDRTLYTILAKPVPRLEYLLGKLLGVLLMLALALAMMTAVFCIVLWVRERNAIAETIATTIPDQLEAELFKLKASTFNVNLIPGITLIFVKAAIVAAVTLLLSTFATSWLFTVIMSMIVYLIGHVQPIAREYVMMQTSMTGQSSPIMQAFLGIVALAFPDFQLFNIVDDVAVGAAVPMIIFAKTAAFGFGYIFIYTLVGYIMFANREL